MMCIKRIAAAIALSLPVLAIAAPSLKAPANTPELIALEKVHINGESIPLPTIRTGDGYICTSYLEIVQPIAYGINAYRIGKSCYRATPEVEQA